MRKGSCWSAALLFLTALTALLATACGKEEPVQIRLIVADGFSGFFSLKPSQEGIRPIREADGTIVYVVQSPQEAVSETTAFAKWHILSAQRRSGEPVAVDPNEKPADDGELVYELSVTSDGTIIFLLGSVADKEMYYSLSRPATVGELNKMRKKK